MNGQSNHDDFSSARDMQRPAEHLVLEGYRHWARGHANRDDGALQPLFDLYQRALGPRFGRPAAAALGDFAGTLCVCARCPLRFFAVGSHHVCSDELLVIGLIAGIQNGDDETVCQCLHALTCPKQCNRAETAAGQFALILKGVGLRLLPMPASRIDQLCAWPATVTLH